MESRALFWAEFWAGREALVSSLSLTLPLGIAAPFFILMGLVKKPETNWKAYSWVLPLPLSQLLTNSDNLGVWEARSP